MMLYYYLIIGVILTACYLHFNKEIKEERKVRMTLRERVESFLMCAILWPVGILIYILSKIIN